MTAAPFQLQQALQLAMQHLQAGRLAEARRICHQLLAADPDSAEALHLLGVIESQAGELDVALTLLERARRRKAANPFLLNDLGVTYGMLGRNREAEKCLRRALAAKPDFADAHNNLGNALSGLGQPKEAERSFRRALALDPGHARAHNNLGNALKNLGRLGEAEQSYRRAIASSPDYADAHSNLASALLEMGRIEEAEQGYRHALSLNPDSVDAYQNLLFALNHVPGRSAADIYAEHREFARRFCPPVVPTPHGNLADPARRLRIGYVSGDFRDHPVIRFIAPVLAQHDRAGFEVFCYYNHGSADAETARLKHCADHWRDVAGLPDEQFAALVREDAIDILVDLSGHSVDNRLTAFARKPAPVQATWLGYLNTTGLAAMDYRISDAHACPQGLLDDFHSERLVRLPDSQWCYRAPAGCPDVSAPRSVMAGHATFASFSNLAKIGPPVIELWSRLLACVPDSRLLVVGRGLASIGEEFLSRFARHGVDAGRIELRDAVPFRDYLALHAAADIVLDTFPYAGGTTTCHSLWMGVPVVSLAGDTATSRGGASLLNVVGLGELVANTQDRYLDIAAALARDRQRLATLRAGMRERMAVSPLMDAARFTRNLESAYRFMWRIWCESGK